MRAWRRPGSGPRGRAAAGVLWLTVATLAPACATSDEPRLVTIPQPGIRPATRVDQVRDYATAAATVARIFERDLGFSPFPVTFEFYPHADAFEKKLLAIGYDKSLARATAGTMIAVGGYRGVLLNDAKFALLSWTARVEMIAHEMGHSLQYEWGGGRRATSEQWLREGFAEWLALRVLERLDATSIATVRRDRQRDLRAAGRSGSPRLSDLVTFPAWVRAGERYSATRYVLAFLAVDFLLERHGLRAVVDYFTRFARSDDRLANFRAAFGEDIDRFETGLGARLWKR